MHAINRSLEAHFQATEADLDRRFEKWWPDLRDVVTTIKDQDAGVVPELPQRSSDDLLAEILDTVRGISRHLEPTSQTPAVDALDPEEIADLLTELDEWEASIVKPGAMVRHKQFGVGKVLQVSRDKGGNLRARIDFDSVGAKQVVVRYASLEPA